MFRSVLLLGTVAASECNASTVAPPAGRPLPLGEEVLMDKDVVHIVDIVDGTDITVVNRGRGMTIEDGGGHEVFATLDIVKGTEKTSLELHGWEPQSFVGHEFALTGIGEKHSGSDVKVKVTKK